MRRVKFDAGVGRVYVLSPGDELASAPLRLQRVVPTRMRKAFETFPAVFAEGAKSVRHAGLRRWLAAACSARCRLRLYDTEMFGRAALLDLRPPHGRSVLLDFRGPTTRTRRHPPSAPRDEIPRSLPAALAELHALCGGMRIQFGASGSLLPPDALRPWPAAWKELGVPSSFEETLEGGPLASSPERTNAMIVFYEDSGSFACAEPDGRATWVTSAGDALPMGTVEDALDLYFTALLEGKIPSLYPQRYVDALIAAELSSAKTRRRPP